MASLKYFLINSIILKASQSHYRAFCDNRNNLKKHQADLLKNILFKNHGSHFGQSHEFKKIASVEDFRSNVPVRDYDEFLPWIEKLKNQKGPYLTSDLPPIFEKTSGSTKESKYVPMTKDLLSEIQRSTGAWIYDVFSKRPALKTGSSYWSISPKLSKREITSSGIPVGFNDDSEYFSGPAKFLLNEIFSVNPNVSKNTPEQFFYLTALSLIKDKDLSLISIWSPTFLINILDYIESEIASLSLAFKAKEQSNVKAMVESGDWHALWPKLIFLSCWTSGSSKYYAEQLVKRLPLIEVQGKGLFMTEGIISIPMNVTPHPLLAYRSHFFEFEDLKGNVFLAHEIEEGHEYVPIITTSGGLYRYRTHDLVKVRSSFGQVPSLEFLGRSNLVSDLCGEKISEIFLLDACKDLDHGYFFFAPVHEPVPHYGLFSDLPLDIASIEQRLLSSHHYKLCRDLKQLGPLRNYPVSRLKEKVEDYYQAKGIKLGNIKHKILDLSTEWKARLNEK